MQNQSITDDAPVVSLNQFASFLKTYLRSGEDLAPIMGWGPVGTGKSSIVRQVAEELEIGYIDTRISQLTETDTRGVPDIKDGKSTFAVPDWFPNEERDGKRGAWVLDEYYSGLLSTQVALYSALNEDERYIGDYKIPSGWTIIGLSNRPRDGASVTGRIDSATGTRWNNQFTLLPEIESFTSWAYEKGIDETVIAFLNFKQELLHEFPNGGIPKGRTILACPRTWKHVSKNLSLGLDPVLEHISIEGSVGKAAAAEFVAFKRLFGLLPDWKDCFSDPDNAPVPADVSTQYAIIAQLSNKVGTGDQFEAGARYASRMSNELVQVFIRLVVTRDDTFKATSTYIDHSIANQ